MQTQDVFVSNANRTDDTTIPDTLYRVTHAQSASVYSGDIVATAPTRRLRTNPETKEALAAHLNPRNRTPTPFISVTSSAIAALRLALYYRDARKLQGVTICQIDAMASPLGTYKFTALDVREAAKHLGYEIPKARYEWTKDEFVVLRKIPRESVIEVFDIAGFEGYLEEAAWLRSFRRRAKHQQHHASTEAAFKAWHECKSLPSASQSGRQELCRLDPDHLPNPEKARKMACEATRVCGWCAEYRKMFSDLHVNGFLMGPGLRLAKKYGVTLRHEYGD